MPGQSTTCAGMRGHAPWQSRHVTRTCAHRVAGRTSSHNTCGPHTRPACHSYIHVEGLQLLAYRKRLSMQRTRAPVSAPGDAVLAVDGQLVGHVWAILASPAPGQDMGRRRRRLGSLQLLQRRRIGSGQAERGRGRMRGVRWSLERYSLTMPKRGRGRALGRARNSGTACHQARACQEGQQARQRSAHRHCDWQAWVSAGCRRGHQAHRSALVICAAGCQTGLLSCAVQNQAHGVIRRVLM